MTENKAGGILLIFVGIMITSVWITIYAFGLYDRWYHFNIFHAKYLCTFWEYFWQMGKLQILLAGTAGACAFIPGIYLLFKKSA